MDTIVLYVRALLPHGIIKDDDDDDWHCVYSVHN